MNRPSRPAIVLRAAAALAIAAAITGFAQTGASASQQVSVSVRYTCVFPVIGSESAPVEIDSNIPTSIAVGQSTAHYAVNASVTAPAELATGLRMAGVSTITGTVDGQALIEAPDDDFTKTVPFAVNKITIPLFSSFTGTATGSAPDVTFSVPGRGEILVGDLTMHLVPRDSNGNVVQLLGEMTVPCTVDSGQNDVAATFAITAAPSPAASHSATAAPNPDPDPTSTSTHAASPSPSTGTGSPQPTGTVASTASAASSQSASAAGPGGPSKGGDAAWMIGLGSLLALVAIGAAAFRYRLKLRDLRILRNLRNR